jgi:transposase
MVNVAEETNVDILRQVAQLALRENSTLHERIEKLMVEISQLRGDTPEQLELKLAELREMLAARNRQLFAKSSEKRPRSGALLEAEQEPAPQTGHGPTEQKQLVCIEKVHELDSEEQHCDQCGGDLAEMGDQSEDSEEISVVERRFVVVRHRRRKYRCRCNATVKTAPGPPKLIPGGRYSPEFAVETAIGKYLDHLPLERQVRIMGRQGLAVTSQTLWNQIDALARHLEPSYEALGETIFANPVIHADETRWPLLSDKPSPWWAWCVAGDAGVFYRILGSRSAKAARAVLRGYQGIVLCDGYKAYVSLSRGDPNFTLAHCWAHVRRKFIEAEPHYPAASQMLDWIGKLYALERQVPWIPGQQTQERLAERAKLRNEQARPLVDQIKQWAIHQSVLPRSSLGKAIGYLLELWPGLTRFLDNPRIPLDNNRVERAIRGPVVGRKNHYGSRSRRGTEVAAIFYSLIETAKHLGVDPHAYLSKATFAAIQEPGTVTLPGDLIEGD